MRERWRWSSSDGREAETTGAAARPDGLLRATCCASADAREDANLEAYAVALLLVLVVAATALQYNELYAHNKAQA